MDERKQLHITKKTVKAAVVRLLTTWLKCYNCHSTGFFRFFRFFKSGIKQYALR